MLLSERNGFLNSYFLVNKTNFLVCVKQIKCETESENSQIYLLYCNTVIKNIQWILADKRFIYPQGLIKLTTLRVVNLIRAL